MIQKPYVTPDHTAFFYVDDSGERGEWYTMTPREREFTDIVVESLEAGVIPTPTLINEAMGLGKDNNLHGRYSKIRRAIFVGAGLVKNVSRDRWEWPS